MHHQPATLLCDFYKLSHRSQYPPGTETVYSTWIPRESRVEGINAVVTFGIQSFIKRFLIDYFNEHFFARPEDEVVEEYKRVVAATLGTVPDASHLRALHQLGYLPLRIRALPEGTLCPIRVPMMTIENTHPDHFWLTNYLETLISCEIWMPATTATISWQYRKLLQFWAEHTGGDPGFVPFQGHDFSMRGMSSLESAANSGAGHLLSFVGTDTIPGIIQLEKYYGADVEEALVGTSIPATEHSVMCSYGRDELESYRRLITEVYPEGFVSIVSDTYNLWDVMTEVLPQLHEGIMKRDGRVVIRPDSGDPVLIVCGDPAATDQRARKGVIELLWEQFGGTETEKGYRLLDSHIGCIYGDAITLDRAQRICQGLAQKGFASTNMVFGIGSYSYQYQTRDTFGFAMKSTWARINGQGVEIYKDPATDTNKVKKSLTGRVMVINNGGTLQALEHVQEGANDDEDCLEEVFVDGQLVRDELFTTIRDRLQANLA